MPEAIVVRGDVIVTDDELQRCVTPEARKDMLKRKAINLEHALADWLRERGYEVAA